MPGTAIASDRRRSVIAHSSPSATSSRIEPRSPDIRGWPRALRVINDSDDCMIHDVSIPAALIAGLVSFLSPCVLPLVPPYLIYLTGATIEHLENEETESAS